MHAFLNTIKDIVTKKFPTNNSGVEVSLSVAESLVLIIDICEKENTDAELLVALKRLYLEGTKTEEEKQFVRDITQIFLDKNFSIKSDPNTISEDPTRRYFETNLAYFILQDNAESLDPSPLEKATSPLEKFTQNLRKRLFALPDIERKEKRKVEKILKGEMNAKLMDKYELEYAELTHKLLTQSYYGLSKTACKNLYQVACNSILATLNTQIDKSMPVDLYNDSVFTMGKTGRGRIVKKTHDEVITTAKGLMKSTSPLPIYHDLVNPVELYSQKEFSPFQRSADQSGFMIESAWSQHIFSRQTHPYSNGISSTTLAQVRNILLQKRLGHPCFSTNLQEYLSVFSALMVYNSGGHSFFEIFEVLKLPFCQELLRDKPDLLDAVDQDSLMYKVLYHDQKRAFDSALQATKIYTKTLLNKKLAHAEMKKRSTADNTHNIQPEKLKDKTTLNSLHNAVLNASAEELEVLLGDPSNNVDALDSQKWTPLMVAAQLGKTEHVKALLRAGANINKRVDDISSLTLAIKSQKFATVQLLLNENARTKNSSLRKNLKKKAPALYLACRQNDIHILNALLDKGRWNINDKKEAILVALKLENLEVIKALTDSFTPQEKQKYFSGKYKTSLLNKTVALGNVQLVDELIQFGILPAIDTNYSQLLEIAATKGFLPMSKYLLDLADKDPKLSMNMDSTLRVALKNKHFDQAILSIIYGAKPELIPTNGNYLRSFNSYLKSTEHCDLLFTEKEVGKINERVAEIKNSITARQNKKLHGFLTNLVAFLNRILPNSLKLGYNEKTDIIKGVTEILDKSLHKHSLFNNRRSTKSHNAPEGDAVNRIDEPPSHTK